MLNINTFNQAQSEFFNRLQSSTNMSDNEILSIFEKDLSARGTVIPTIGKYVKRALNRSELTAMVASCSNAQQKLFVVLAIETGYRQSDIINLKFSDLFTIKTHNGAAQWIMRKELALVERKTSKNRTVSLSRNARKITKSILGYKNLYNLDIDSAIFGGRKQRATKGMAPATWCRAMRTIKTKAATICSTFTNVARIGFKSFRKTYAQNLRRAGKTAQEIMENLNHSLMSTTEIYLVAPSEVV